MTSYEQQMLQRMQNIFDLLDNYLRPLFSEFTYFVYWIEDFLAMYSQYMILFLFGILLILTLKWLSRW